MYEKVKADVFLKQMFGMDYDLFAETVIATPIWDLDDFRNEADKVIAEFKGWYKGITLEYHGKLISVVNSGIGAPLSGDCILAMSHSSNVKNIIFSGSAGAVNSEYKIGDIIFADQSVVGEGYSRYIRNFEIDCFGKVSHGSNEYSRKLASKASCIVKELGTCLYFGKIFTTDSILGESREFINYVEKKGCDAIEMEVSAVFTAARKANKKACAVLLISDLPLYNRNLFEGLTSEENKKFGSLRVNIAKLLLEIGI